MSDIYLNDWLENILIAQSYIDGRILLYNNPDKEARALLYKIDGYDVNKINLILYNVVDWNKTVTLFDDYSNTYTIPSLVNKTLIVDNSIHIYNIFLFDGIIRQPLPITYKNCLMSKIMRSRSGTSFQNCIFY